MPYASNSELPAPVRDRYSDRCQSVFRRVFNQTLDVHGDEGRAMATAHTAAANCMGTRTVELAAVKFVDKSDSIVRRYGMPFGGPKDGRDFDGEFFSARTDFMLDWVKGERPLIYQHGLDEGMDDAVVGRVVEYSKREEGMWTIAQLDLRARYIDGIRELVDKGALSFSSGAYPSLVRIDRKSGEIMRWPWVELSLTPTPANPYAVAGKSLQRTLYVPAERRVLTV